ncbi:ABC transporter substrate-binding protein [Geomonas sp. Red32]|uniref:ABC transporter substrate-binding protein n=1 Tax=Geomonas sp. Red32 TaxID=2912856 RepID=UPI00202CE091|nr:ABC transporter substrate-binding protein [Geomonas sp. Red32]MCM0083734.1 ABC transporter substrate-binding protein [Geomonas sp. Red32]
MKKHLLFILVLLHISQSSAAVAADVVRVGNLKLAHFGAVSYMKEIAPKYNLKIEERFFPKGIDIFPAMVAGEIDVAASGAEGAVAARAAGIPIYIVAGFAKGGARIVGRSDRKWHSVADLKGKRVGAVRGGAQELLLLAELAKHHLSFSDKRGKDVQVVYLPNYGELNQALLTHYVDAICQSEPQSAQAIRKGFGVEIVKPFDTPLGDPTRALTMTQRLYTKKDVAQRLLKCFVEATRTFLANPALAEKYVRESMFKGQLSSQEYRMAVANSPFTYDITVRHIQTTTELMAKYGIGKMAKPPVAKEYVKTDLLEKAKRALAVR